MAKLDEGIVVVDVHNFPVGFKQVGGKARIAGLDFETVFQFVS
jgi:hypothetical protein